LSKSKLTHSFETDGKKCLKPIVKDLHRGVYIFGAVPPPCKLEMDKVKQSISNIAKTFQEIRPDAVIVYDIQDEKSRNGKERPFPFFETHNPRLFAKLLAEKIFCEVIVYQALEGKTKENFPKYLSECTEEYGMKNIVYVGGSDYQISVPEATKITQEVKSEIFLGGITIPERHRDKGDEHLRIMSKADAGVTFFTSQVVYNPDNVIGMMRDYDELCKEQGKTPARIILAFAPFGRLETLKFLEWLGVEVADGTAKRVLRRKTPQSKIEESNEICWENLRKILDATRRLKINIPLGIAVESVSKYRDEQKGAEDLFIMLRKELEAYYNEK